MRLQRSPIMRMDKEQDGRHLTARDYCWNIRISLDCDFGLSACGSRLRRLRLIMNSVAGRQSVRLQSSRAGFDNTIINRARPHRPTSRTPMIDTASSMRSSGVPIHSVKKETEDKGDDKMSACSRAMTLLFSITVSLRSLKNLIATSRLSTEFCRHATLIFLLGLLEAARVA